jgi:hypothetical protein
VRLPALRPPGSRHRPLALLAALAVTGMIGLVVAGSADAAPIPASASVSARASAPASGSSVGSRSTAPGALSTVPGARVAAPALPGVPDCKTPPTPELPGRGVVGFFETTPAQLPAPADPFAPGSKTTIEQQYGFAGLRFNTYDLGCGGDLVRSPDAAIGTTMANWILMLPKTLVAATGALLGAAYEPKFLSVFDPLVSGVVDALRRTVFDQWAAVVVVALGFLIVWRARKASLASTTAAIGWALLVMIIATVLFRWPVAAGQVADRSVGTTLSTVTGGLNGQFGAGLQTSAGDQATSNLHEALLYKTWLGGTFGDANSAVAQRYGPKIFDAQALTWNEAQTLRTDPAQGARIIAAKEQEFRDAAAAVQAEDPDAYEYLVGRRSDTRVGYAVLAAIAALCAVPFLIVSALLVIGALVIVRFGVMLFPAFATLGLFPTMRHLIIGIGNTLAAAVINALIFGIGSAVMVKAMGVVLDPATGLPPWLDIILVLILTVVMWAALSPFRRLTRMVAPGHDPFRDATTGIGRLGRGAARAGGRAATAALTGFVAGRAARDGGHDAVTADDQLRYAAVQRPTRAEAGGPTYGSISTPGSVLPPVPAEPVPEGVRVSGYPVLAAGPAGVSGGGDRHTAERSAPEAPSPVLDAVPPSPRGWSNEEAAAETASRLLPPAAPVEPEDLEGEQVYVLYRPGAGEEAQAVDVRDGSGAQAWR